MKKIALVVLAVVTLVWPNSGFAHCDGLDGPVVKAAQRALESGELNSVLIWVAQSDEAEIKSLFEKTLAVRQLNAQARELADVYFSRLWCESIVPVKERPARASSRRDVISGRRSRPRTGLWKRDPCRSF